MSCFHGEREIGDGGDSRPVVCQIVHTLNVGGAEVLAANLARRLRDRFRFVFLCLDELGPGAALLLQNGFEVELICRKPGLDWKCARRLAARWKHHGAAVVQAHQYGPFFYSLLARFGSRRPPIIFTEHGRHHPDRVGWKRRLANRVLLRRHDRVIGVCNAVKTALAQKEGIPEHRIDVIRNGIDTVRFRPSPQDRTDVRAELSINGDEFLAIMVARLDPVKDHQTALRAAALAAARTPGLRLAIVGDGPERASIEEATRRQGLENRILMLGMRRDVPRLLAAADALLLTSVSEGIPLTVIEAMASGLPVISTRAGSVPDVVRDGETGLLASIGNAAGIADHLVQLRCSPALCEAMGRRGRERAVSEFSEQSMAESYAAVLESAIESARRPWDRRQLFPRAQAK
jgi:glycosyltransferase involved in cell wall biosynthesis